jgi:hypothetical protein
MTLLYFARSFLVPNLKKLIITSKGKFYNMQFKSVWESELWRDIKQSE